ncbi:hypothetical protein [Demetria terragena]|uniref:hypothetical protein n=1 Tax=Demetria terragena TaxID=63959 RepID=UPI000379D7DD|nr:hypothetical protein [Demetria terragena]
MRSRAIRATVGVLATAAVVALTGCQEATAPASPSRQESPSGASTSGPASAFVPAEGARANGYTAVVREPDAARDTVAELMLVGPDGRSKSLGDVSAEEMVWDISPDARTVLTARKVEEKRILTVWDTASGKPTKLDAPAAQDAVLVKDGILVLRKGPGKSAAARTAVYSVSGKRLRSLGNVPLVYPVASADGRLVAANEGDIITVRDTKTGALKRAIDKPKGKGDCYPGLQYGASDFAIHCTAREEAREKGSVIYVTSYEGDSALRRALADDEGIQIIRKVAGGAAYGRGVNAECAAAMWAHDGRVEQAYPAGSKVESARNDLRFIGAYGATMVLAGSSDCRQPGGLLRVDLKTGKSTHLIGEQAKIKGYVTSARTVDGT